MSEQNHNKTSKVDSVMDSGKVSPVEGEPTRFWVESSRAGQPPHMVDLDDDGKVGCSCHDFMCRNHECKHIRAVKLHVFMP